METGNTAALVQGLVESSLDVGIMVNPDPPQREMLQVEVAWDFPVVLVTARPEIPRRCRIADLAPLPFILFKKGSQVEKGIGNYLVSCDFHPRVIMRFDNAEAIKAMLKIHAAVSMLPLWAVEFEIRSGSLFLIEQAEHPLPVRRGGYRPAAANALLDIARRSRFKWLAGPPVTGAYGARTPRPGRRRSRTRSGQGPRHP